LEDKSCYRNRSSPSVNRPFLNPVILPIIGATKIGVVTLQHGMGFVVTGELLLGEGIAGAIVSQDPKTRHQG
jgi:hypothetical protein